MLSKPTSSAQRIKLSLTLLMDNVFPVPGHPHTYRLPAFSCWTHALQNSNTRLCSLSRQINSHDGTVATCSASLTALICAGSAWHDQFSIRPQHKATKRTHGLAEMEIERLASGIPLGLLGRDKVAVEPLPRGLGRRREQLRRADLRDRAVGAHCNGGNGWMMEGSNGRAARIGETE